MLLIFCHCDSYRDCCRTAPCVQTSTPNNAPLVFCFQQTITCWIWEPCRQSLEQRLGHQGGIYHQSPWAASSCLLIISSQEVAGSWRCPRRGQAESQLSAWYRLLAVLSQIVNIAMLGNNMWLTFYKGRKNGIKVRKPTLYLSHLRLYSLIK